MKLKTLKSKPIKGYENLYFITEDGKVIRNGKKLKESKCGGRKRGSEYLAIVLCKNGKVKTKYIHRLVAEHYILNKYNKKTVNHKDGNRLNNNVSNLEWATGSEQNLHAQKLGLKATGEKCSFAKLKNKDVRKIRKSKKKLEELSKQFSVCIATISMVRNRKIWRYV